MAEIYTRGSHKIFYRSKNFAEGLVVLVDMLYQDLSKMLCQLHLTEVGGGLYFFNFSFPSYGTYVGVFYENSIKVSTQNFLVVRERGNSGNLLS